MDLIVGESTWAFGNHICEKNIGSLVVKIKINKKNKNKHLKN